MRSDIIPDYDKVTRRRSNESIEQKRVMACILGTTQALEEWFSAEETEDHASGCPCHWCECAGHLLYHLEMMHSMLSSEMLHDPKKNDWHLFMRDYVNEIAPPTAAEAAQTTVSVVRAAFDRWVNSNLPAT